MQCTSKRVFYQSSNSYETLNEQNQKTKNIWVVFHGIGYLSKYFLKHFEELNPEENYLIAPQAPSKYYLKNEYKYVGASWLTKVDTQYEIQNKFAYLDAVAEAEQLLERDNLILFGFSQGVSILTRWVASRGLKPKKMVLYAGGLPNELVPADFDHLDFNETTISMVYGSTDVYLTAERMTKEQQKIAALFKNKAEIIQFEGGHELKPQIISQLLS